MLINILYLESINKGRSMEINPSLRKGETKNEKRDFNQTVDTNGKGCNRSVEHLDGVAGWLWQLHQSIWMPSPSDRAGVKANKVGVNYCTGIH